MPFRLATYNALADPYVRPSYYPEVPPVVFQARMERVAAHIRALHAEVVCVQEATSAFLPGAFAAKKGKPDGCLTLGSALESRMLHFADGTGHVALLTRHSLDGRVLGVANTHLRWDREGKLALGQIRELLSELDESVPWAICGDFNVEADSQACEELRLAGFRDTHALLPQPTCYANGRWRRLDFIWISPGVDFTPVPLPTLARLPTLDQPSDHLAVIAELNWRG